MELTFVHQYSGDTPKRRRLAKACESCRARKASWLYLAVIISTANTVSQKRCVHFANDHEGDANGDGDVPTSGEGASTETPSSAGGKRFVSDLNPEAAFLSRPESHSTDEQRPPNDDMGIWVDRQEWEALIKQKNQSTNNGRGASTVHDRPHSSALGPLVDVYFNRIQPFLPLLDEGDFRQQQAGGLVPEPLVHAVCLIAAKDVQAEPHLKLGQSTTLLPAREFCSRLHASVMGALRGPCRYDKVTLIRILAIASMHNEGADVAEDASMLLSQAMHHAQTLGIHPGQQSSTPSGADLAMKRLFWCLYALDRANSSMNGRPIIMSDIDIAIDSFSPGESGYPAFEAWLRITDLLNQIIAFYRPKVAVDFTGWEDHYPGLEEIFDDSKAWDLPQSVQATLHLFYLSVAVLSHRSRGIKQISRGTHSSIRQRLCATEVIRLMESSYGQELNGLPFIPYSVSLSLSVAYQHLRQSQFQHQQEDAHSVVRQCTKILQRLRRTWSSADAMAALAQKVLAELDRAPSLASFRIKRTPAGTGTGHTRTGGGGGPQYEYCMPTLNGERMGLTDPIPQSGSGPEEHNGTQTMPTAEATTAQPQTTQSDLDLFNGMDDIFGTYLDPNYPNLEDFSFVDNMQPFDWSTVAPEGGYG